MQRAERRSARVEGDAQAEELFVGHRFVEERPAARIDDQGEISGQFTKATADDLALTLRSGALPAKIEYQEERTVGPSLGADSIRSGVTASLAGLIFILMGPAHENAGTFNLMGALRTSMATCGYADIPEFHRAEVMVAPALQSEGKQLQRDQAIGMGATAAAAAAPVADNAGGAVGAIPVEPDPALVGE